MSGKFGKYEYLIGKEILPFNQRGVIEHAMFTYSVLLKHTQIIEDQVEKQ